MYIIYVLDRSGTKKDEYEVNTTASRHVLSLTHCLRPARGPDLLPLVDAANQSEAVVRVQRLRMSSALIPAHTGPFPTWLFIIKRSIIQSECQ